MFFQILRKIAVIVYTALDYNLTVDEQCQMSHELEELIASMTAEGTELILILRLLKEDGR